MKKLMMALGIVALAATVQAANFRWYNGSPISPVTDNTGTMTSGTVYLFAGNGQADLLTGYVAAIAASTSAADYLTGAQQPLLLHPSILAAVLYGPRQQLMQLVITSRYLLMEITSTLVTQLQ